MTFMPASITFRFDPVIVQYHRWAEWRALFRHVEFSAPGIAGVLGRAGGGERCDHDDG